MIGLLLMLAAQDAAEADTFQTGNDLYELCAPPSPTNLLGCAYYIQGTMDLQMAAQQVGAPKVICSPPHLTARQLVDIVVAYLRDKPSVRHENGASLAVVAIGTAFPCPKAH